VSWKNDGIVVAAVVASCFVDTSAERGLRALLQRSRIAFEN
jgi:hypothetical protein